MYRQKYFVCTAWILSIALSACGATNDADSVCHTSINGSVYALGKDKCLKPKTISKVEGVILHGFELSLYLDNNGKLADFSNNERENYWAYLSPEASATLSKALGGSKTVDLIQFEGSGGKLESPGLYGHAGFYKKAILIKKIDRILRIKMLVGEEIFENKRGN